MTTLARAAALMEEAADHIHSIRPPEETRRELRSELRAIAAELQERDCEETHEQLASLVGCAYQIVGALAHEAGVFDHPDVQRALDVLSRPDEHEVDGDLLPWPKEPLRSTFTAERPLPEPPEGV